MILKPPMFPDFALEPGEADNTWRATTGTMRPPIRDGQGQSFTVLVTGVPGDTAEEMRSLARTFLIGAYRRAHPNNCAKIPEEVLTAV